MNRFDVAGFCIEWEQGDLGEEETIRGFQHLIDTGLAWQLQGCYGRQAMALIENGQCFAPGQRKGNCSSGQCGK